MRLKFKPWANDYVKDKEVFIQNEQQLTEFIGDANELRMEFGSGKGQFIHQLAKENPEIKFIGVEKYESVIVHCGEKLKNEPLDNLMFLAVDVLKLTEFKSLRKNVDLIYLNFSDPWPKKRHTKRRLTSETFLPIYTKLLSVVGHIEFKTDNQLLFEYSLSSISSNGFDIYDIYLDLHNTDIYNIKTEYEEKFSSLGFRINKLSAKVVGGNNAKN